MLASDLTDKFSRARHSPTAVSLIIQQRQTGIPTGLPECKNVKVVIFDGGGESNPGPKERPAREQASSGDPQKEIPAVYSII